MMSQGELNYFRQQLLKLMRRLNTDRLQLKDEAMEGAGAGGEASGGISSLPVHLGDLGSHEAEEEVDFLLLPRNCIRCAPK